MSNTEVKSYYAGSSWGLPPVRYGKCQVFGSLAQLEVQAEQFDPVSH